VVDGTDLNGGFHSCTRSHSQCPFLICRSRPLQSDPSHFEGVGLFGILIGRDSSAALRIQGSPPLQRKKSPWRLLYATRCAFLVFSLFPEMRN